MIFYNAHGLGVFIRFCYSDNQFFLFLIVFEQIKWRIRLLILSSKHWGTKLTQGHFVWPKDSTNQRRWLDLENRLMTLWSWPLTSLLYPFHRQIDMAEPMATWKNGDQLVKNIDNIYNSNMYIKQNINGYHLKDKIILPKQLVTSVQN